MGILKPVRAHVNAFGAFLFTVRHRHLTGETPLAKATRFLRVSGMTSAQASPAQAASDASPAPGLFATSAGLRRMANAIRALSMDAVEGAKSGHPGMPMGMADVATVLFAKALKFDAGDPAWPNRDRFVLSAGHGSMLLYSLLHLTGYESITLENIRNFRKLGSPSAGHPEFGDAAGVETTTGPLGQGIGNAVGMALAERLLNARYGDQLVDHRTYVIASDGDLMEGVSHEACVACRTFEAEPPNRPF